jgi:hypothetical protein
LQKQASQISLQPRAVSMQNGATRQITGGMTRVLWSLVTVAALGFLLGLKFRVPALLAVSVATAVAAGSLLEGPMLPRILFPLLVLQCAYLAGLVAGGLWRRDGSARR